jgi:hypothetical protein
MGDTFVYEIPFEAKATLCVNKWQIVTAVAIRAGRHLTEAEGDKVWADIKHGDDWKAVFPVKEYLTDKLNFAELLKEDIETAANKIVSDVWDNVYDDVLKTDLDKAATPLYVEKSDEEITLANIEQQTQKRIQDDNVRNGLARCANETKKKSIEKWKRNYFLMEHNIDIQNITLPDGKTEEDLIKHLEAFILPRLTGRSSASD